MNKLKKLEASTTSFNELIDFLEVNGNAVLGKRWRVDKEGLHTYMTQPIDFALIYANYNLGDDVLIDETYKFISTAREWMDICHRPGLKYNPMNEGYSGAYYYD